MNLQTVTAKLYNKIMIKITFKEYFCKFEKMQRWIINDLVNSTICAHANLLVAMGIFNYIEILGSFRIPKNGLPKDRCADRFDFVIKNLFPKSYRSIINKLNDFTDKGAYDCLRCGFSHEYLAKTYTKNNLKFIVCGVNNRDEYDRTQKSHQCGIKILKVNGYFQLYIINSILISDLNSAFEKFKLKLLIRNSKYKKRFIQRCEEIHLEELN